MFNWQQIKIKVATECIHFAKYTSLILFHEVEHWLQWNEYESY